MAGSSGTEPALSPEIRAAVWRIFSAGAAPGARGSAFENIEPVIRLHVPPADQNRAIVTIGSWFDSGTHVRWLNPDRAALVADLVLEGVGPRRSEDAIWAIASIGLDLSVGMIRRRWSSGETDSFVEAAIEALNGLVVGSPIAGSSAGEGEEAEDRDFREAALRDGMVGAFARLEKQSLELLSQGLHPTVANLIDLAVDLSPERSPLLIERLKAPTMQAKAARRMVARTSPREQHRIVGWITKRSGEAAVALAIVHTLSAVRKMDEGRMAGGIPDSLKSVRDDDVTREEGPPDDAAASLLVQLLERLGSLDPSVCLRWVGELLSQASLALSAPGDGQKPLRLVELEGGCTRLAAGLFQDCVSADLLSQFQFGLRPGRRKRWVRHQTGIAKAMRELSPERAAELARATLDEHRRRLAEQRDGQYLASEWGDWNDREWLEGLGTALALSGWELDLPVWVAKECRDLPLSVWDAEEDLDSFAISEQIAQHWLLVALLAIPRRSEFGRPIEPFQVCALAEAVWAHCRFCRQHLDSHPEASVAAELAARYAMRFGQADDQWVLNQARGEGVGPRTLCVLVEERRARRGQSGEGNPDYDEMIIADLVRIASNRFEDGGQFDLDTLEYWGKLWLSLGAVDQAERTAMAIVSFPLRATDRNFRILALKLLGLVVRVRKPRLEVTEYVAPLYNQLWPVFGGTPAEERAARQEIEQAFIGSELIAL